MPSVQTNGRVYAIAISGDVAYLGGTFTAVRPAGTSPGGPGEVARSRAAAVNLDTGAVLPWDPDVDDPVRAIAVGSGAVYLGGTFRHVGTTARQRLAAVDPTSGAVETGWTASTNAAVYALAAGPNKVYVGGSFTIVDGTAHHHIAALSAATGSPAASFTAAANGTVKALALNATGKRLLAAGSFLTADGADHSSVVSLSSATGRVAGTTPNLAFPALAIAVDGTAVYVGGGGNGGNLVAYDPASGVRLWHAGTDGNVQALAAAGGEVYVGGHFENSCGPGAGAEVCRRPIGRQKLLAVNSRTGKLQAWDPRPNSVHGVFALAASGGLLAAGGDFTKIDQDAQQAFAIFPS
ncbi:MAG TPA: PQQ-binding-like beta-propeller repeat protein [Gaiellales bacterium]|jgi:outer membrane protein assembly factor BamB|nr:PQQ-binding-like beta-propeller repeat protein [Gaiellales bacterium]